MTTQQNKADETHIRKLIDEHAKALGAKDADGVLAAYAPNLVRYDLAPPLRTAGIAALDRRELEGWFATWRGPLGYEVRDIVLAIGGDIAFAHGLVRISGTKTSGERNDVWARQTLGLRRSDGGWKIVHEHTSVPFYMDGSDKAAVDLKP